MKLGLWITAALRVFANVVQEEYKPKSSVGRMLRNSTTRNYQAELLKFKGRLINCKIHQRYLEPRNLGTTCKAIIADFQMMYNNSFEKLESTCRITKHHQTIPCFHQMF